MIGRLFLIFVFWSFGAYSDEIKGNLELSTTSGRVPLTVKVLGPDGFVNKGLTSYQSGVGCGQGIDWGDGERIQYPRNPTELQCSQMLTHIYKKTGTFKVKATVWHPGPDDGPITDWEDQASVQVLP